MEKARITNPQPNKRLLSASQLEILDIIFCYRFVTAPLLCSYLTLSSLSGMHKRLKHLVDRGYIGRHYFPKDSIYHKPAVYFLLAPGILALKKLNNTRYPPDKLRVCYKDKDASVAFQEHCVAVLACRLILSRLYGDKVRFYPRMLMPRSDALPNPLPDGFIVLEGFDLFVEVFEKDMPRVEVFRKIEKYEYCEGIDESEIGVLLICDPVNQSKVYRELKRGSLEDTSRFRVLIFG